MIISIVIVFILPSVSAAAANPGDILAVVGMVRQDSEQFLNVAVTHGLSVVSDVLHECTACFRSEKRKVLAFFEGVSDREHALTQDGRRTNPSLHLKDHEVKDVGEPVKGSVIKLIVSNGNSKDLETVSHRFF